MQQCPLGTLDVFLGVFLAAVDGTIVSTAMPTAVGALGGLELDAWAFAAYMLFAAVTMPLYVQTFQGRAGSAALAAFPLSIGWSGTSMLTGRVVHRIGQRRIAVAGRIS
jgi:MFS family permease